MVFTTIRTAERLVRSVKASAIHRTYGKEYSQHAHSTVTLGLQHKKALIATRQQRHNAVFQCKIFIFVLLHTITNNNTMLEYARLQLGVIVGKMRSVKVTAVNGEGIRQAMYV
jgi:hypothetical protein